MEQEETVISIKIMEVYIELMSQHMLRRQEHLVHLQERNLTQMLNLRLRGHNISQMDLVEMPM